MLYLHFNVIIISCPKLRLRLICRVYGLVPVRVGGTREKIAKRAQGKARERKKVVNLMRFFPVIVVASLAFRGQREEEEKEWWNYPRVQFSPCLAFLRAEIFFVFVWPVVSQSRCELGVALCSLAAAWFFSCKIPVVIAACIPQSV